MSSFFNPPQSWKMKMLGEVCEIAIGGTPSRNEPRFWATDTTGYPWVAISDLGPKWITKTQECITYLGVINSNVKLVRKGTPLMSFKLTIGRTSIAGLDLYTNEAIAAFTPYSSEILLRWLYYALPYVVKGGVAEQAIKGQTLNKDKLQKLKIFLPLPDEQCRITTMLDEIDREVQEVEQVISSLKGQRVGLLHDLLTCGLDEHGDLRNPHTHPAQFKKDPQLGQIPKQWDTVQLGCLAETITSGSRGWAAYYSNEGPLFLRIGNLTRDNINLKLGDLIRVNLPPGIEGTRTKVKEGDILISITADLGCIGVIPSNFGDAYVNQHIALVRLKPRYAHSRYIGNYLAGEKGQKQFHHLNDSGAKAGMNLPAVAKLLIALPSLKEQEKIADVIDTHERHIRAHAAYLDKLQKIKIGLAHDLLTGRIRFEQDVENDSEEYSN